MYRSVSGACSYALKSPDEFAEAIGLPIKVYLKRATAAKTRIEVTAIAGKYAQYVQSKYPSKNRVVNKLEEDASILSKLGLNAEQQKLFWQHSVFQEWAKNHQLEYDLEDIQAVLTTIERYQ